MPMYEYIAFFITFCAVFGVHLRQINVVGYVALYHIQRNYIFNFVVKHWYR